jgi:MYXO-CTERM domain-containing protein
MPRWVVCVGLLVSEIAAGAPVGGRVYVDEDHDGAFSAGDTPVANAIVWMGRSARVKTGADGRYSLTAADGVVWVRTPDGFTPYPPWRHVSAAGGTVDFPLARATAAGPLRFVQASDSHVGVVDGPAAGKALAQAATVSPPPWFVVITGDLTQGNLDEEFSALDQGVGDMPVPFVAVRGNHDSYDGGATFEKYLGPATYSFDVAGTHVVVMQSTEPGVIFPFLDADLADVAPGTPVIGFLHYPPAAAADEPFVSGLRTRGVTRLFTGHWHETHVLDYGGVVDYNVSPLVMGGIDMTPGGWRVVTVDGAGVHMQFHTTVEAPVLRLVHPRPGGCVPAGALPILAAAEDGGAPLVVTARVDQGAGIELSALGGWARGATTTVAAGTHTIDVTADRAGFDPVQATFCVDAAATAPAAGADWPQLQGGPRHLGATAAEVAPPLRVAWARAVGGHLRGGSPVLAAGRLFVPVVDPGGGVRGGVVALDAATGATLWEWRIGHNVHNAPAVDGGVVVAAADDGVVHGLDAATGAERWTVDLGDGLPRIASTLCAAPTIVDGVAYVGVVLNLAAIDVASGAVLWQRDPTSEPVGSTFSSLAVDAGVVVGMFGRGYHGMVAFDAQTGEPKWTGPGQLILGGGGSPVVSDGKVYTGNSASDFFAADLASGDIAWQTTLADGGGEWSYWLMGTPAMAAGRLYVPSQAERLFAVDAASGATLWTVSAGDSVLHPTHYEVVTRSFASSPVVTGGIVWAGAADGILRAIDAATGDVVWSTDLGVPVLSGLVPSSPYLYVSTWDGTVRAFVRDATPPPPQGSGCSVGGPGAFGPLALLGLVALRRRRRA